MIGSLRSYPTYNDTGLSWLGSIPVGWKLRRTKTLLRERSEKGHPDEPLLAATQTKGVVRKEQYEYRTVLALKDLHLLKLVREGDFVISLRSFQGGIEYARDQGIISPAYTVLYPSDPSIHGYLALLFKSRPYIDNLRSYVTGIRQGQNLDYGKLSRSELPLPPAEDQLAIIRFLIDADRRIVRYIRAKRRLIELLEEQKQEIIHRAVTRGLDPNVRLKSSGVDWIGDTPEHWQIKRVKQASKVLRGKFTHRPRNDPDLYGGPYPFLQTGDVARASKLISSFSQTLNEKGLAVSKLFPRGTLAMAIAANIGDVAILDFDACFPDSVVGFVPRPGVDRDFLYFVFLSMKAELLLEAPVNTQGNLNIERIGSRALPVPPPAEQKQIVHSIEHNAGLLDVAISTAVREVSLVREYRTRLIADVVTGKLDVRGAAAELPDEAAELVAPDEVDVLVEGEVVGDEALEAVEAEVGA